jgi:hypothetical protein
MEAMIDAGVHMGFSRETATILTHHTLLGSTKFAMETGEHPAVLRNSVTSPAGTTASAIYELENGKFRTVIKGKVASFANMVVHDSIILTIIYCFKMRSGHATEEVWKWETKTVKLDRVDKILLSWVLIDVMVTCHQRVNIIQLSRLEVK